MPRGHAVLALAVSATVLAPSVATAHFVLRSPLSWRVQDATGSPQKVGPCGNEGMAATTEAVTAFAPGETITISLDETIFHPGHYRVALAVNDRSELPAEPTVTAGATACGSVPIMNPPVFPLLADGILPHTAPLSGTQSIQVTLPSTVTCTHCTLQVLEFMSSHGAPCFYHHCADISIGAGGGTCGTDVTLADVHTGFLGVLQVPPCSTEQVPPMIFTLFGKANTLVAGAAQTPAKAGRFLNRASKSLRRAAKKVTKAQGRRISTECATSLDAVLGQAQLRVQCLLNGA